MTTIEEQLDSYFSSLNPITKRIWNERENIKNAFGEEEWKKLSAVEQEDLLARYMIDEEVRQKYADMEKEPTPELFPKMKINCGEKMVVDFDNDDACWQDEHSGPFSWMTKSQQDLTLDDLDNLSEQQAKRGKRGKSHSPDRDPGKHHQKDAIYDINKGTNYEAANTADEIFKKFGIAFSFGKNEGKEDSTEPDQNEKVTDKSVSSQNENKYFTDDDTQHLFEPNLKDSTLAVYNEQNEDDTEQILASEEKTWLSKGKSEAEVSLIGDKHNYSSGYNEQVSPVYENDFGQVASDQSPSKLPFLTDELQSDSPSVLAGSNCSSLLRHSSSRSSITGTEGLIARDLYDQTSDSVICIQPTSTALSDLSLNIDATSKEVSNSDTIGIRSGYDFLDNW